MFYVIHEIEYLHDRIVNSFLFQLKLELLIVQDSYTMMTFAFTDVFTETGQNHSHCMYQNLNDSLVLSGLILTLIGVVFGLIIILVRKLHSTSTLNIFFMVITMIILFVGVVLLMSREKWLDTAQACFTRFSLDLLLVHNVYCESVHSILSECARQTRRLLYIILIFCMDL
ncbi:unnamed protein product [Schistosoma rodhaini]|uniref:Uncharacterized protein n=1 Tax=Schistosoma rodhaini TaxID=6188 RepID=A0AA85GBF4_9TREM|nr:unnamed protein product [Schistosoma rodhaini]CAH8633339.1 unnamed protein product [Schistosoma rodhaini]